MKIYVKTTVKYDDEMRNPLYLIILELKIY